MSSEPQTTTRLSELTAAVLNRNPAGTHERSLAMMVLRLRRAVEFLSSGDPYSQEVGGPYLAGWREAILVVRELFDDDPDGDEGEPRE